jgi:hypothetical protein
MNQPVSTQTRKATPLNVPIDDLVLDPNNPRFAELYGGSNNEDDLIEYLLYTEAAEEVAKMIAKAGEFYPDRPLWVLKQGSKFIVKDGNRRCAAVKALQTPGLYKLGVNRIYITELPVLLYENPNDLNERIIQEHAGNLFRRWERIAKALEVMKLADSGKWSEALELDSSPGDLIKLASFYKEAVKSSGDDLRLLLRRGRGETGGKTIIFERLFRDAKECGYQFSRGPSYRIQVKDSAIFTSYVIALVRYLKAHPETKTETVDKDDRFIDKLQEYGFNAHVVTPTHRSEDVSVPDASVSRIADPESKGVSTELSGGTGPSIGNKVVSGRGSTKKFPDIKRKAMPPGLRARIREYFLIDARSFPNSKTAMARVTFECVLKFVVDNTKHNGKTVISKSPYFQKVHIKNSKYTDFGTMKSLFTDLITDPGKHQAFKTFDFDAHHAVIHNYNVSAISTNADQIGNNLIPLIEFMLQDENDLLSSLDLKEL